MQSILKKISFFLPMYVFALLCGCWFQNSMYAACPGPIVPKTVTPGETITNILDRVQTSLCADVVIYQEDIPYTITKPGAYKLGEFITNNSDTPAITIASNDVLLDLGCHGINQVKSAGVVTRSAIFANGFNRITIRNGGILMSGPLTSAVTNGINLQSGEGFLLYDLFISGQNLDGQCVSIFNSIHVELNNIFMQDVNTGIVFDVVEGFRLYSCYVTHTGTGYLFLATQDGTCTYCVVTDAIVTLAGNPGGPGFNIGNGATQPQGIYFDSCTAESINTTGFLVNGTIASLALDIVFRNCTAISCGTDGFSAINSQRTTFEYCQAQHCGLTLATGNGFTVINDGVAANIINCSSIRNANHGYSVTGSTNVFSSYGSNNPGGNFNGVNPLFIAITPVGANYWLNLSV